MLRKCWKAWWETGREEKRDQLAKKKESKKAQRRGLAPQKTPDFDSCLTGCWVSDHTGLSLPLSAQLHSPSVPTPDTLTRAQQWQIAGAFTFCHPVWTALNQPSDTVAWPHWQVLCHNTALIGVSMGGLVLQRRGLFLLFIMHWESVKQLVSWCGTERRRGRGQVCVMWVHWAEVCESVMPENFLEIEDYHLRWLWLVN